MARICREEGWHYVTYHGSMDHSAREQAIVKFSDPEQSKSIMLASLKSGGQGLNLTVAARVIIVDPWWNSAIEQQGFCRVYRIGQVRTSQLARMVVRDTIDDKMEAIKRRKDLEINSVMDNPSLSDSLEFNELLKIFGQVGHDTTGRPFIIANSEIQGNARVARDGSSIANQLNQEGNFTDEP
jgi:SNF2 family DNA or RNA helicase